MRSLVATPPSFRTSATARSKAARIFRASAAKIRPASVCFPRLGSFGSARITEFLLQLADCLGERRLSNVETLGRLAEVQELADG